MSIITTVDEAIVGSGQNVRPLSSALFIWMLILGQSHDTLNDATGNIFGFLVYYFFTFLCIAWFFQCMRWFFRFLTSYKIENWYKKNNVEPNTISLRSFFLLCYSESFSMVAAGIILYDVGLLGDSYMNIFYFSFVLNAVGYLKYVYQAYVDPEYITLSFHLYNVVWFSLSLLSGNPLYYVFFRGPFHLLTKVEQYMNMKGRKILFDELSITVHCVDHLIHGLISVRILIYHFMPPEMNGLYVMFIHDLMAIPFCIYMSDNLITRIQDPKLRNASNDADAATTKKTK